MSECLKCDGNMELTETDSRQEWCEETYYCDKCDKEFIRRIEYKTQSELVESDTLKELVK